MKKIDKQSINLNVHYPMPRYFKIQLNLKIKSLETSHSFPITAWIHLYLH